MQLYYFHMTGDLCFLDPHGQLCDGDGEALAFGRAQLNFLLADDDPRNFEIGIQIVDSSGREVAML